MKVLLVAPTVDTCYEAVLPLGLMNLYLIGENLGCDMELLDLSRVPYKEGLKMILSKFYDVIGISCNFTNAVPYVLRYAKDIKNAYLNVIIIAGGNHATLIPGDLLFNDYDYILNGEGEASFKEFLQRLLKGGTVKDLRGVSYFEGGEIIKNPSREPIDDLDTLPFNDYSKFNLEPYFKWSKIRYLNIETSRGCIHNCSFCATVKMWGHRFRHKTPQRIIKEFAVAKRLKCDYVFLCDDDTALNEDNLRNFCQLLIKENISVPWGTTIGSKSVKDPSTFSLMAKSGCVKVNICIESANPRILQEYRKPYTIEDNRRTCFELSKRKILVHNHGIIGSPRETLRETMETYFYLIKTSPMWHVSALEPRPGTDYWQKWCKKNDQSQYELFGKANIILSNKKISNYIIYRFFALCYFLNPFRLWNTFFNKRKVIRYNYRIQYYVAYRTVKENLLGFLRWIKSK